MWEDMWMSGRNEKSFQTKTKPEESFTKRWDAPRPEAVKINIDAAFRESSGNGGWGAICRNSESEVCFDMSGPLVRTRKVGTAARRALHGNSLHKLFFDSSLT
jgi:hypothetical protein